ncbi:hypothetical protein FOXYSP1_16718 [Fusarium oxysporum f. sp. phaseoli]
MIQLPVLSDGVTDIDVSTEGRWILGTTNNYIRCGARVTPTIRGGQALPTGPSRLQLQLRRRITVTLASSITTTSTHYHPYQLIACLRPEKCQEHGCDHM